MAAAARREGYEAAHEKVMPREHLQRGVAVSHRSALSAMADECNGAGTLYRAIIDASVTTSQGRSGWVNRFPLPPWGRSPTRRTRRWTGSGDGQGTPPDAAGCVKAARVQPQAAERLHTVLNGTPSHEASIAAIVKARSWSRSLFSGQGSAREV